MATAKIRAVRSLTGDQPPVRRIYEAITQSFKAGAPVYVDGTGGIAVWPGVVVAAQILGFAMEAGSSLTTIKVPKTTTEGSVDNQPLAQNIPRGAKLNDAKVGVELGVASTVFFGQVKSDQTPLITDVGVSYGLTVDTDGHWYVDKTKTLTSGGGGTSQAVVQVVKLDDYDARGVQFVLLPTALQMLA